MKKFREKFILFQPVKSSMQSGLYKHKKWCLANKEINETYLNSKFCWTGTSNPEKNVKIFFDTKNSAIKFAKKYNYDIEIIEPKKRKILKKSYSSNFIKND